MFIRDLYETVNEIAPCSQPKFLSFLDTTARSLIAKYGTKRVINDKAYTKPYGINDDFPVKDEYRNAIISNILYYVTGNTDHKVDYVAEAEYAYKTVWREDTKKLKLVGEGYYDV